MIKKKMKKNRKMFIVADLVSLNCRATINTYLSVVEKNEFLCVFSYQIVLGKYIGYFYFFEMNFKLIYFIECIENIRIFTSAVGNHWTPAGSHEWL